MTTLTGIISLWKRYESIGEKSCWKIIYRRKNLAETVVTHPINTFFFFFPSFTPSVLCALPSAGKDISTSVSRLCSLRCKHCIYPSSYMCSCMYVKTLFSLRYRTPAKSSAFHISVVKASESANRPLGAPFKDMQCNRWLFLNDSQRLSPLTH